MFTAFAFAATLAAAEPVAEPPRLTLYTEDNPPYSYLADDTDAVEGLLVTIVKEMMDRAGVDYSLTLLPWRRAFNETQIRPNTCLFGMDRTAERENKFRWVSPLFESGWSFYRRADSDIRLETVDDIAPYTIAATSDYASARALVATGHDKILMATDNYDALALLYRGRVDLMVTGDYEVPYLAAKMGMPEPVAALPFDKAIMSMGCSLETDSDLMQVLQQINDDMAGYKKQVMGLED